MIRDPPVITLGIDPGAEECLEERLHISIPEHWIGRDGMRVEEDRAPPRDSRRRHSTSTVRPDDPRDCCSMIPQRRRRHHILQNRRAGARPQSIMVDIRPASCFEHRNADPCPLYLVWRCPELVRADGCRGIVGLCAERTGQHAGKHGNRQAYPSNPVRDCFPDIHFSL